MHSSPKLRKVEQTIHLFSRSKGKEK